MARTPIYAAGGIVLRGRERLLIAVVQRSKDERWVLPRGKLKRGENPRSGARREVVEETGHRVRVHEFLGAITYRARGRPKVVQFWRMQAYERPSRDVTKDIIAVDWLPLGRAVRQLSYPLEKLFLQHAGRRVLKHRKRGKKRKQRARRGVKTPAARRQPRRVRARKVAARKATARKSTARKSGARKSSARKRKPRALRPARAAKFRLHAHRSGSAPPQGVAAAKQTPPGVTVSPTKRPTMLQRMPGFRR